jgi:transposase, IS5 family
MIRYNSNNQLSIEEFKTPFQTKLNPNNRWVLLSQRMPWDEMAGIYYKSMSTRMGAPSIDARIIIGAMIIKHKEKLDDRGTILAIEENPYMQYFLGLSNFIDKPVFDPSLFVTIRKRIGVDKFDQMSQAIIKLSDGDKPKPAPAKHHIDKTDDKNTPTEQARSEEPKKNKGKLQMDATVADAYIKYPTDLDLLNDSREKAEELIDVLSVKLELTIKPRTYRREARKKFLLIAKKKNKSKKEIRRGIRQQLGFLKRDIKHLHNLLDQFEGKDFPLDKQQQKYLFVIQHVYEQQQEMYTNKQQSCKHRIVGIHQPHVRPIVRGKAKAKVEFGAKIGVSLSDGFSRIDTLNWEAYNESTDLKKQVEGYKDLKGYYPELVQVDGIYLNRENRNWLKERNIRYTGKPLGRPQKIELTGYQKRKNRREMAERNQIEGKFGQGKNGYRLNQIRARLQKTSESWIGAIFFVMNLVRFSKDFLFSYFCAYLIQQSMRVSTQVFHIVNLMTRKTSFNTRANYLSGIFIQFES